MSDLRDRALDAIRRHRQSRGGPAVAVLESSEVMAAIVAALDEESQAREAEAKAERKRVAKASADALGQWETLRGEIDRLDAGARAVVSARIGADLEPRVRAVNVDDDSWRTAMGIAATSWWTAARSRPAAAEPLIIDQVRIAFRELLGGGKP